MLHLSTRWGFASIRRLALATIKPPTPHYRLLLARTHSVDDWVVPALSALCERTAPLNLSEAREMDIEDVVLVVTMREVIRRHALQTAEISRYVEAVQAEMLAGCEGSVAPLSIPKMGTSVPAQSPPYRKQTAKGEDARERGSEPPVSPVTCSVLSNRINSGEERRSRAGKHASRQTAAHHGGHKAGPSGGSGGDGCGCGQCAWGFYYRVT